MRSSNLPVILACLILSVPAGFSQSSASIARTPPMGWNSYNSFGNAVSDKIVRDAADQLVATGMKDAGYTYVNIDSGWQGTRDVSGVIHPNARFPDIKGLVDYVHSKGLKIGIYSSPGPTDCSGLPGSLGHEEQDAKTYAEWGFDYLKYDLCSFDTEVMQIQAPGDYPAQMKLMIAAYDKMGKALQATGHPFVYSLCQYGLDSVWEWGPSVGGNLWRTTRDLFPDWFHIAVYGFSQAGLGTHAGPGHWNDPDMLEVGNGRLTLPENRSHFSLWAMLAAPLIAGNNLPLMTPDIAAILTNREVIAIDQDPLGEQGDRAYAEGEIEVWTKRLSHGALAICVINNGSDRFASNPFYLKLRKLHLKDRHGDAPVVAEDLWTGKEVTLNDRNPIELASHDVLLLRIDRADDPD